MRLLAVYWAVCLELRFQNDRIHTQVIVLWNSTHHPAGVGVGVHQRSQIMDFFLILCDKWWSRGQPVEQQALSVSSSVRQPPSCRDSPVQRVQPSGAHYPSLNISYPRDITSSEIRAPRSSLTECWNAACLPGQIITRFVLSKKKKNARIHSNEENRSLQTSCIRATFPQPFWSWHPVIVCRISRFPRLKWKKCKCYQ